MDPVDAFLDQRVLPAHRDLVGVLRQAVKEAAPHATLQMSYGLPMWKGRGYLAYLSPSKRGITFGFPYGVSFADPDRHLKGTGKYARHLLYRCAADVDVAVLRTFLAQAVDDDAHGTRAPA